METGQYLDRILAKYASSFDIEKDFEYQGRVWSAYARFFSLGEKYVLSHKAKLWTIRAYEYVLFQETERCSLELLDQLFDTLTVQLERDFVRRGGKYPEKDHMYSYLSAVVISRHTPEEAVLDKIRRLHFDRGYLFSLRGHSEFHLIVADLEKEQIHTNRAARNMSRMYRGAFDEIRRGAKGYNELYETGESPDPEDDILQA